MVEAISPISATSPSSPTKIDSSTSITSEPDNAWVAARQSHITADLLALKKAADEEAARRHGPLSEDDTETVERDGEHSMERQIVEPSEPLDTAEEEKEEHTLSGESERIGTWNFDDDTPFGERVAIV